MKTKSEQTEPGMSLGHISIDLRNFGSEPNTDDIPVLPTRNLVLFPGVHLSLGLGRESSIRVAEFSEESATPVVIVCQEDPAVESPKISQLYKYGVIADILKVIELPDGSKTAIVRGREKCYITGRGAGHVLPGVLSAKIRVSHESSPTRPDAEFKAIAENIIQLMHSIVKKQFDQQPQPPFPMDESDPVDVVNAVATNIPFDSADKLQMLRMRNIKDRAWKLLAVLQQRDAMLDIRNEVMEKAREGMENNRRSAFLQQQMEAIRDELYGDADDSEVFAERASKITFPAGVAETVEKEIGKLRRLNPQTPDYSVQYAYLDSLLSLPWDKSTELNADFAVAENVLESDHYGLEKVKERIIEQLAVIMDNPKAKAPIICLVGPPGVGKTSLGISIAKALGRKYQRVALGGLHDEAEIRGHRRTYIGAMPGRIIDAVRRAGSNNPVLLLDEIDKIGADYKGDPAAALLEVLDPEQNCHFHDNYIDVDFDLSNVLFIATANTLDTVSRPLLDRIEVIEIPGYLLEEKVEIAKRHLLPRLLEQQKWDSSALTVSDDAYAAIIDNYTSESGVRQLEKALGKILRKAVVAKMRGKDFALPVESHSLRDLLGNPPYHRDRDVADTTMPGVATGLAWTQVGGETLLVEVSLSPAKDSASGGNLTLTGNLGAVMKESATIALQWVKAHATELTIDTALLFGKNVHLHFPEGAVPKDGPSAGITITTALVSAFTGQPVREHLAMTGEATLRGRVLPVGGIREKLLAAKRAGVTDIIVSTANRTDVQDIPPRYLEGVTMHYVDTIPEVLEIALPAAH